MESSSSQPSQTLEGSEWSPQQPTQQSKQLQLQENLYLKPRSQLQYLGQSHLPAQSAQSRNRKEGMDQYQYREDDEQVSDKDKEDNNDIDEEEDEEEDDDDGIGREKIFEKVDLHDSQDIRLYTGEVEPVEDETKEIVEVAVPEWKDEETVTDGKNTKLGEDDVDPKVEQEGVVLRVRDGIEDKAGASPEEFPVELVSDSGLIDSDSELPPEGGEEVMELGSDETEEPWQQLQRQQQQNQQQQQQLQLQQQKQQQMQQLQEMESESDQTQQQLEKREESSTLDSDSIEELERQSQQSPESDLPLEAEVGQDNLVQIDSAENNGAPQNSLDYLDHLFKFQQSDEELNYGDPQLERQVPPQWRQEQEQKHHQEQQQQEQKQQKNEEDNFDQDELQEELPREGSSQGGRLQNFQKNIHQFDQQQKEMELLQQQQEMERLQSQQQQQQQQQQNQQQQDLQQTDSEVNTSGGANDAYSTTLIDTEGSRKPEFSESNRNDPKVGEFAEAGVDGSANNAKIDNPNLVYEDGNGFNGNNVAGDNSNINSFGDNFVEQNVGFDNGMVQNGNHYVGNQSVFHQGVDHNDDLDSISNTRVNNFQGGGAFPNGVDERSDGNGIVDVDNGINNFQGDAFHPNKGGGQITNNGFFNDNSRIDNVKEVGAFANGVNDRIEGNGFVNFNNGINNFQGDSSQHNKDNNRNTQSGFVDDNGGIDNVQGLGIQDNSDVFAHGNNRVNNLQGVEFPNEVNGHVNSNGFVNEFAANSPLPNSQGKNQQFDQVPVVQNEYNSNEIQNFYSPLDTNPDPMRQFGNHFLPPDFTSNSEKDLVQAQTNLVQTQRFEIVDNYNRSNPDYLNNDSKERQNSNAFDFDGNQENSVWNGEDLARLAQLDSDSRLLEDKRNVPEDIHGGQTSRNYLFSSDASVSVGNTNEGSIGQADVQEKAGFRQDSGIRQEADIQGQVHVLRQADRQSQHDDPDGAGSQPQANFQRNFVSNTQEEIVSPNQIFSRQEGRFQKVDGSEEQYDHRQVDHLLETPKFLKESTAQIEADVYEGQESTLEKDEPNEQIIQSGQKDGLQDLNDVTLEDVSQEQARYQQYSNSQEQNIFQEEVKYHEKLNSRQVSNPEEQAGLNDEAELEESAGEVEERAKELDFKVEEFQTHFHVRYQADFSPQQQQIDQEENTEALLLSGNPNKNQIDSGDTTDKNEVVLGNASDNQSNPVLTQSETLNRAPHAKGRNMADDVELPPKAEQGQRSAVRDSAQSVEKIQTNGEQDEQAMGDSQQLSQIIASNGVNIDSGIQDRIQQSERIIDSDNKQSEEQHVDMDAYEMSPFGGLNDGHAAGGDPMFQQVPQGNNKMRVSLEGQKPESIGLQDQSTRVEGFPSVSEYYSSIRKKSAHDNMISEGEKTLLQKRREQRQQLRQQ